VLSEVVCPATLEPTKVQPGVEGLGNAFVSINGVFALNSVIEMDRHSAVPREDAVVGRDAAHRRDSTHSAEGGKQGILSVHPALTELQGSETFKFLHRSKRETTPTPKDQDMKTEEVEELGDLRERFLRNMRVDAQNKASLARIG